MESKQWKGNMDKEEFKKEVMELFYKETGYQPERMDNQDPDIITDIVLSYYQKGFKDGQKATVEAFNQIRQDSLVPKMSNSMSNDD